MDPSQSNDPLTFVGSNDSQKFGEIYCNFEGKLTFQCVFCPSQMKDIVEFNVHYIIHFRDVFVVKKEEDHCVFEPEIGIDEINQLEMNLEISDGQLYKRNDYDQCQQQISQLDCSTCDKTFESQCSYVRHAENHAMFPECFHCDICGSNIKKKKDLLGHMKDKHSGIKHPCSICGKEFNRSSYLTVHKRIHEDNRPFKCTDCGHAFVTAGALSFHMKKHNNTMPQCPCIYCGKVFERAGALAEHVCIHTGEKPFACSICTVNFRTKRLLREHKATHLTVKEYPCDECEKNFTKSSEVIAHKRNVHSDVATETITSTNPKSLKTAELNQKATINCYLCDKAFVNQANLNLHIQNHSLYPDSFECDICGSKIKKKKDLLDHMKHTHSGIKFPSDVCGKSFARSSYLMVHTRMHNGERAHQCATCGKTFIMAGSLTFHMRKHNNTMKKLPCSICGKVFNRPGALADHVRVHTGEKPFECDICHSSFRTRKYFNEHKQIHLDVKNHECNLSGMKFKQAAGVRNRKRKVHGKRVTSKRLKGLSILDIGGFVTDLEELCDRNSYGETLGESDLPLMSKQRYDQPFCGVKRTALNLQLKDALKVANISVPEGWKLKDIVEGEDSVTAVSESNEKVTGSFLIGCDGINAASRSIILRMHGTEEEEASYTGLTQTAGMSPTPLSLIPRRTMLNVYGPGAHFICYPVSDTTTSWAITQRNLSAAKETWKICSPADLHAYRVNLLATFKDWCSPVPELIGVADRLTKYGLYDRPQLEPNQWYSKHGRSVLIGDAAHPTSPHLGQGANQALEDCYHLTQLLPDLSVDNVDIMMSISTAELQNIFEKFANKRQPRTAALVKGARMQGETRVCDGGIDACTERDNVIRNRWSDIGAMVAHGDGLYKEPF